MAQLYLAVEFANRQFSARQVAQNHQSLLVGECAQEFRGLTGVRCHGRGCGRHFGAARARARQQLARARLANATALGHYNRHLGEPLDRQVELEMVPPAVLELAAADLAELQARAVRWALFDGGQSRHRAAALRRSSESLRERRAEYESLVRLEVHQSRLAIDEADARVSLTRDAIAEANENLRITRELYNEGLVTNTQVLEAVALQTSAEGQAADAVFDAAITRLQLLKSIGEL